MAELHTEETVLTLHQKGHWKKVVSRLRVDGGWLYTVEAIVSSTLIMTSTFVPDSHK